MIKKSILICLCLFLFYNYIFVPFFIKENNPITHIAQSQWQENIIKAQNYLYLPEHSNGIVVGSSLSAKLKDSSWYNLSFLGGSPLTGLELIKLKHNLPGVLLIETNVITRDMDPEIIAAIAPTFFNKLKYVFPAFLEKNQPMKYIGACLFNAIEKSNNSKIHKTTDNSQQKICINLQVEENSKLTQKRSIDKNILLLGSYLRLFQKHKVKIFLIEMPIDMAIFQTKNESYRRNELFKAFPTTKYNWIIPSNINNYKTTDGIHLTEESLNKFKEEIAKCIYFINCKYPSPDFTITPESNHLIP